MRLVRNNVERIVLSEAQAEKLKAAGFAIMDSAAFAAEPAEEKAEDLSALGVAKLKEIAKGKGLRGYSSLAKAELLELIQGSGSK